MEEIKEYKLRQILESLISAYQENEKKLIKLKYLTCARDTKIDDFYYYIAKDDNKAPELMLKYVEEKNFLEQAMARILEMLNLDFKKKNAILCAINNNGEYVINGKYLFEVIHYEQAKFKNIADGVLSSEFAQNIGNGGLYISGASITTFPSAFNFHLLHEGAKNLGITYKSHNNILEFQPNGLAETELEEMVTSYTLSSEFFNEYQRKIIESGTDTIGITTVNCALEKAYKRIRKNN